MIHTYRVTLLNPSANPDEIETEYIHAESQQQAEQEAANLVVKHPFNDIQLISVELITPGELYHNE